MYIGKRKEAGRILVLALVLSLLLGSGVQDPATGELHTGRIAFGAELPESVVFHNTHNEDEVEWYNSYQVGTYHAEGIDGVAGMAYCVDQSREGPDHGNPYTSPKKPDQVLSYILKYGYPSTTKIGGHQWNKAQALVITQIAIYHYTGDGDNGNYPLLPENARQAANALYESARDYDGPPFSYGSLWSPSVSTSQRMLSMLMVPQFGKVSITKTSKMPELTADHASYSLKGAEYTLYHENGSVAKDKEGRAVVLVTDEEGSAVSEEVETGDYYLQETKASPGFAINRTKVPLSIEAEKTTKIPGSKTREGPQINPVEILFEKKDADSKNGDKQGGASLEGAHYRVDYYDNTECKGTPIRSWVFRTVYDAQRKRGIIHYNDSQKVSGDALYKLGEDQYYLPLGSIRIQETKAPEGYTKDGNTYQLTIKEENARNREQIAVYQGGTSPERIYRGDLAFVKVEEGSMRALPLAPFRLTSKETGESHILVADRNGRVNTRRHSHSSKTNANDRAVDPDGKVNEEALDPSAGVWFYGQKDAAGGQEVTDSVGALPYGEYLVEELPSSVNEGLSLVRFTVYIEEDKDLVDRGTVIDEKDIELRTTALGKSNGEHIIPAEEEACIVDRVDYRGAIPGERYRLAGSLVLAEDPNTVLATAEKEFTPTASEGSEELEFCFDAAAYAGQSTVVFERLYEAESEILLCRHEDPEDRGQTVHISGIRTRAALTEEGLIVDKVYYENLIPGQEYLMRATLYDRDAEEVLEGYRGETIFTPASAEGEIEVAIPAEESLAGKRLTIFENCYLKDKQVARHEEADNKDQQVELPELPVIEEKSEKEAKPAKKEKPAKPQLPTKKATPKTGDAFPTLLLLVILALSVFVVWYSLLLAGKEGERSRK